LMEFDQRVGQNRGNGKVVATKPVSKKKKKKKKKTHHINNNKKTPPRERVWCTKTPKTWQQRCRGSDKMGGRCKWIGRLRSKYGGGAWVAG